MTKTQTYSILPVSQATFQEIMIKLQDAGYDGQIHARQGDRLTLDTIDMHGLALQVEISEPTNEPLPAPLTLPELIAEPDIKLANEILYAEMNRSDRTETDRVEAANRIRQGMLGNRTAHTIDAERRLVDRCNRIFR